MSMIKTEPQAQPQETHNPALFTFSIQLSYESNRLKTDKNDIIRYTGT